MMVKILVVGDLHGRMPRIKHKDFDFIIMVGDVCSDKEYRPFIKRWIKERKNESLKRFIDKKVGKGRYNAMDKRSLDGGRKIMEKMNSYGVPVFITPGNWDQSYGKTKIKNPDKNSYNYWKSFLDFWIGGSLNKKLSKGLRNVHDCHFKHYEICGLNIVGYGLSSNNENPSGLGKKITKKEFSSLKKSYDNLIKKLDSAYDKRNKKLPTIFLTHNVPYNTKLDKVTSKKSTLYGKHLGSAVAKEFVKKRKPFLCIGGHMHENKGKQKIGKTLCVNAGYGRDSNFIIEVDEKKGKVKSVRFIK